jgi:ABC-type antimicrobial peptide transport system permease subunit
MAVAAAVLGIARCSVSVATSMRERRAQNALLSVLGVPRAAQGGRLCLEELMLSLPAAAAGLGLGAALSSLLVPAVTLTTAATAPVPAALTEFAWPRAVPLAIVVACVPVLAAATTVAARPDPAAQLRATEAT